VVTQGQGGTVLVATRHEVLLLAPGDDTFHRVEGLRDKSPTCLAAARGAGGVAGAGGPVWCGTTDSGVYRSDDGGRSWRAAGLPDAHVTALTLDPAREGVVWAGAAPSAVWCGRWRRESALTSQERGTPRGGGPPGRGGDRGAGETAAVTWDRMDGILDLPSSDDWSFPPRPETHHVRWIACHPTEPGRLWAAIEAGALIWTEDGGATRNDRVQGSPHDTHELAIHRERPDVLRIAAGDGYFESDDGGRSWRSPMDGLDVGYLRSVAVAPDDPDVVTASAASKARSAYASFRADGRLYRRTGDGPWERILSGWPEEPETIAPLLLADPAGGRLLAADERGVHASSDGGGSWEALARFDEKPAWLRGLAVLAPSSGRAVVR